MCVAIPMKIKKIEGEKGIVDIGGVERKIGLQMMPDIKVGEYVIVHAGYAIQKLDEKVALETIEIFKEMERLA